MIDTVYSWLNSSIWIVVAYLVILLTILVLAAILVHKTDLTYLVLGAVLAAIPAAGTFILLQGMLNYREVSDPFVGGISQVVPVIGAGGTFLLPFGRPKSDALSAQEDAGEKEGEQE